MERRNFIKSSLGIGLGATLPGMTHSKSGKEAETAVSPAMPVKSGKPHIILIMTDQQRGDALGCMGNKAVISPNIDRLAHWSDWSSDVCSSDLERIFLRSK